MPSGLETTGTPALVGVALSAAADGAECDDLEARAGTGAAGTAVGGIILHIHADLAAKRCALTGFTTAPNGNTR